MTIPTIQQLFVPLPHGVVDGVTPTTVAAGTWLYNELQNGNALMLPVTAWQSGGVAWTELMITAVGMAVSDANISLHAQAAFLDFCASGSVVFPDPTNPDGTPITVPVTPDPSIVSQNPTGAAGWLDVLADANYNVQRNPASYAAGNELFVNTSGSSIGTFPVGTFHIANNFTGATYKNTSAFTGSASTNVGTSVTAATAASPVVVTTSAATGIGSDTTLYFQGIGVLPDGFYLAHPTGANTLSLTGTTGIGSYTGTAGRVWQPVSLAFSADLIGPGSNAGPTQISGLVAASPGCFVTNLLAFSGSPWESNVALAARCRAKLGSLSMNGPKGAYSYAALTSAAILASQSPAKTLTSAITREIDSNSLATGVVTVTVANASGPVPGVTQLQVLGATGNGVSPIVLQVSSTGSITTGMVGIVQAVKGNTAANGYWTLTVVDGSHVSLNGSTGNGAWTNGGVIEAGDLGLVDSVVQAYAVPNGVTAVTQSATALNTTITATVYVPQAFVSDYGSNPATNKGAVAATAYIASLPIGGIVGVDGASSGVIPYSELVEVLMKSGTTGGRGYTLSVATLLINGAAVDLALTATQVSVLSSVAITVQGA